MTATICAWADDCVPDHPGIATFALIALLAYLALGINDHIGDD